ncbi:hypothetical protein [Alkalihalobacillus deserti]|nr:hypothetical protein [Alkalihalobacillus deserti]
MANKRNQRDEEKNLKSSEGNLSYPEYSDREEKSKQPQVKNK